MEETEQTQSESNVTPTIPQSALFVETTPAPRRNLNDLLMSNARTPATTAEIIISKRSVILVKPTNVTAEIWKYFSLYPLTITDYNTRAVCNICYEAKKNDLSMD